MKVQKAMEGVPKGSRQLLTCCGSINSSCTHIWTTEKWPCKETPCRNPLLNHWKLKSRHKMKQNSLIQCLPFLKQRQHKPWLAAIQEFFRKTSPRGNLRLSVYWTIVLLNKGTIWSLRTLYIHSHCGHPLTMQVPNGPAQKPAFYFGFFCLFLFLLPFKQGQSSQIFLRIIKICSAPHLLSTKWVYTVLQGSQPGAAVPGTGAQWAIFSCYQLNREPHMLRRQASFGRVSNSGQPRDIHLSQLLRQPAALPRPETGKQCNLPSQYAGKQAVPLGSLPGLFWAGLIDTPWQHRNKGPARRMEVSCRSC